MRTNNNRPVNLLCPRLNCSRHVSDSTVPQTYSFRVSGFPGALRYSTQDSVSGGGDESETATFSEGEVFQIKLRYHE